jgi:putative ABC transport system permease protein
MLRSYFHVAWRHLSGNKLYTLINIAGLAVGMATALLVGLWINDEATFDQYTPGHDHVAEILLLQRISSSVMGRHATPEHPETFIGTTVAPVSGTVLQHGYENIFEKTALVTYNVDYLIGAGEKKLTRKACYAQSTLPEIFGFRMIAGNAASLKDPTTLLLSASTAKALFGTMDPIGKTVRVDTRKDLRVGGVYNDLPNNTSFFGTDLLLPWTGADADWAWIATDDSWMDHGCRLFARLTPHTTYSQATERIRFLPTPHIDQWHEELLTYPLDRLHLHDPSQAQDRTQDLWLFGTIGALVLLLACINFMNLSTARSEKRAKEVGIRKTLGSHRSQLIQQFLSESMLTALLAFVLGILLAWLTLPGFNHLSAKEIHFPWTSLAFWTAAIVFTGLTGLLAGAYPAFYLSAFNPVRQFSRRTGLFRKVLVVTQFTVSLSLIIATIVIFRQIGFTKDRPTGYNREGLLTVNMNTDTLHNHSEAVQNDLLRTGLVSHVARSSWSTDGFWSNSYLTWNGMQAERQGTLYRDVRVSPEFGATVGWTIVQGRDFSSDFATDSSGMIINEAALKAAGFKNPIGQVVEYRNKTYHIIGIASNMLTNSPYDYIEPVVFYQKDADVAVFTIRIKPGTPMHSALAAIGAIFNRYNPESPFLYSFNDDTYAAKFAAETRQGNISVALTVLALFISCLGLFSLASFVAEQRTKEIGVRKVLGAGVIGLWALLSKDFLRLVVLSMAIAMPLMALLMKKWLENYTYRTPLSWWIFGAAGAGILLVTVATVSYQSLKAALANPIRALRTE